MNNLGQFLKEGKWMNPLACWRDKEIVVNFPIKNELSNSSIKSLKLNSNYKSIASLSQNLLKLTCTFSTSTKQNKINHIQQILSVITCDADNNGMQFQHKMLYLCFKYLQAIHLKDNSSGFKYLMDWLTDVDSLLYMGQDSSDEQENCHYDQMLQEGDYEQLIDRLKNELKGQQNEKNRTKISFLIELCFFRLMSQCGECDKINQKQTMYRLKNEFDSIFFAKPQGKKKVVRKTHSSDIYQHCAEILLGNTHYLSKASSKRWPIYIKYYIRYSPSLVSLNYLKTVSTSFIKRVRNNSLEIPSEQQFLLDLMQGINFHKIYQNMFNFMSPIFSHLLGYYFSQTNLINLNTKINSYQYKQTISQNLLDSCSKVNWKCFFYCLSLFYSKLPYEPCCQVLLYPQISVKLINSSQELDLLKNQYNMLCQLHLEEYGNEFIEKILSLHFQNQYISLSLVELIIFFCCRLENCDLVIKKFHVLVQKVFEEEKISYDLINKIYQAFQYDISQKEQQIIIKIKQALSIFENINQIASENDILKQIPALSKLLDHQKKKSRMIVCLISDIIEKHNIESCFQTFEGKQIEMNSEGKEKLLNSAKNYLYRCKFHQSNGKFKDAALQLHDKLINC